MYVVSHHDISTAKTKYILQLKYKQLKIDIIMVYCWLNYKIELINIGAGSVTVSAFGIIMSKTQTTCKAVCQFM